MGHQTRREFVRNAGKGLVWIATPSVIFPRKSHSSTSFDYQSIPHVFEKGDTIGRVKNFYGDPREPTEIIPYDPRKIPVGAEIEFLAYKNKFHQYGLTPMGEGNWERIQNLSGENFTKMLSDFGRKDHRRLIPGLIPGSFESDVDRQMKNLDEILYDINHVAREERINPLTLTSIGIVESGLRSKTISPTGAIGAFGLTSWIYENPKYGETNPYNTHDAMRASSRLMRYLQDQFPFPFSVIAYNSGEGAMGELLTKAEKKHIRNPEEIIKLRARGFGDEQEKYLRKIITAGGRILQYFEMKDGKLSRKVA